MKKLCTIVLTLITVLTMVSGLTGCGEKTVTLTNKTVNGLSFDVPDDFGEFADKDGIMLATNKDSTASIAVSATDDSQGTVPADWNKEVYTQTVLSGFTDISFVEFDTQATINGTSAVYAHFTAKSPANVQLESYSYVFYIDVDDGDDKIQTVNFAFNKDSGGSLKTNIDTIRNSIKIK